MTKDEALDLALEALESFAPHNGVFWRNLHKEDAEIANAITAIKQARSAPVQEPVAWEQYAIKFAKGRKLTYGKPENLPSYIGVRALVYADTTPPAAKPFTEESSAVAAPASWMEMVTANLVREGVNKHKASELAERFYSLAQKAVPLTDDQIRGLTPKPDGVAEGNVRRVEVLPGVMGTEFDEVDAWSMPLVLQIARAIEAAHGITPPGGLPS